MKVAFFSPKLNERGTSVAQYDYAHFNEVLLNNESVFITNEPDDSPALSPFKARFRILRYRDIDDVNQLIQKEAIDVCYMLCSGKRTAAPHPLPSGCKQIVHCVFRTDTPFGDVYACISDVINKRFKTTCPIVPHIVHLPNHNNNLRKELGIPENAIVFGRHGGNETFNIQFVHEVIERVVKEHDNIYFLFMNTHCFLKKMRHHPQVIHLPVSYDLDHKVAFINSCDAMLHARTRGESFGLAIGEFSIRNKPVLTWQIPRGIAYVQYYLFQSCLAPLIPGKQRLPKRMDEAHLNMLGDKALIYHNKQTLYRLLTTFDPVKARSQNWDTYSVHYSPQAVMQLFQKHFLQDAYQKKK